MAQMSAGNTPAAPSVAALVVAEATRAGLAETANTALVAAEAVTARAAEGAALAAAAAAVMTDAALATAVNTGTTKTQLSSTYGLKTENTSVIESPANSGLFLPSVTSNQTAVDTTVAAIVGTPGSATATTLSSTFGLLSPQGSTALRTFKAGLASARAGVGACNILTIGDSMTEGTGPTSGIEGRWASRFRNNLRTKAGLTGGRGYVPAIYAVPTATQLFVLSGGATNFQLTYGLGKRCARMNGAGHTITLTVPIGCTDVDLFVTCSSAVVGWFNYTVDGGAGIPASPVNVQALSSATLRDVVIPLATALNPAITHSIVLTWNTGNTYLTGCALYNADKTTGIHLWDGAHHGQASSYFSTAADPWNYTINTIQPALVCIMLGRNDWGAGAATAAQMRTNIETLIANIRAQCTVAPSIVLMIAYGNFTSGTPIAPWQDYVDATKTLATADGDVAVLDLYKRLGTITNAGTNGLGILTTDYTHPSDLGSQMITDALMDFVSYPLTA